MNGENLEKKPLISVAEKGSGMTLLASAAFVGCGCFQLTKMKRQECWKRCDHLLNRKFAPHVQVMVGEGK